MGLSRFLVGTAMCLALPAAVLCAQQEAPEPGTGSTQVAPANQAPNPVQQPDVRLDSKPHTNLAPALDSQPTSVGQGVNIRLAMGPPIRPVTPAGMLARSEPGDPRMVYFALPHRAGDDLSPADRAVLDTREKDLARAAGFHGYDLKQSGWLFQQGICPQLQPDAEQITGVPAGDEGQGFLLLHFVRSDHGRVSAFSAIVPRTVDEPVRVIAVAHNNVEMQQDFLSAKTSGAVVNEAMPPSMLRANLEPSMDWIAAAACIAEMGGAYPHIPNEPYLSSDEITLAPPPRIELMLDGRRAMTFSDRTDETHYVIWNEQVGQHGRMLGAHHEEVDAPMRPVTNPPLPPIHMLATPEQPPVKIMPPPPNPMSGNQQ